MPGHIIDLHVRITGLSLHMCSFPNLSDVDAFIVCRNIGLLVVLKRGIRIVVAYVSASKVKKRCHAGNITLIYMQNFTLVAEIMAAVNNLTKRSLLYF